MTKITLISLLLVASTTAFLSPNTFVANRPNSLLLGTQGDDHTTAISHLEHEYQDLKEKLRHDLLVLKQKQCQVAQEENDLLEEEVEVLDFERFAQEVDAAAAEEELQQAHNAVEDAKTLKTRAYAETEWAIDQAALLQSMDSKHRDLESFLLLEQAATDLKNSQDLLKASQQAEVEALRKDVQSEELLKFLEEKEATLKEISKDPESLQKWTQEELAHHQSLLQVSNVEWEYQKLWRRLREDMLALKHQQLQVAKEEEMLTATAAELAAFQEKEQVKEVKAAFAEMEQANQELQTAVTYKEQAYKNTLWAVHEADVLHHQKGDSRGVELWLLAEAAEILQATDEVVDAAKEKQTKAIRKEVQSEDMLLLLKQKERILKDLRLPGNEKTLEKWIKHELSSHESFLDDVKGKLSHE